nr:Asp23/Gls24 family envelope stress response protein [Chloroflexota bacterium]
MDETEAPPHNGKIVIAPDVLITIAKLATLSVPGVVRMAPVPGGLDRYFKRGAADGVQMLLRDNALSAELYIVVQGDMNLHVVSEAVQAEVVRALTEMVGMETRGINVHIEDVTYDEN